MGAGCVRPCPYCVKRLVVKKILLPQSYPNLYDIPVSAKQLYNIVSLYDVLERAVELTGDRSSAVDAMIAGSLLSPDICTKIEQERKFAENADDFFDHLLISPEQASKLALSKVAKIEQNLHASGEAPPSHGSNIAHDGIHPGTTNQNTPLLKEVFGTQGSHGLLRFGTPQANPISDSAEQSKDFASRLNALNVTNVDTFLSELPRGHALVCAIVSRHAYLIPFTTCDAKLVAQVFRTPQEGAFVDVPAPVFFRTGISYQGQEIVAPALHSELLFELQDDTGKSVGHCKWLLSMSSSGVVKCEFAPIGESWQAPFVGTKRRNLTKGAACVPFLRLCIELGPAMKRCASEAGWAYDGFWRFGVCNDSVEIAVRGVLGCSANVWPLCNVPDALHTFADKVENLFEKTTLDTQQIEQLKVGLRSMPSDASNNGGPDRLKASRIINSWPWEHGSEPFSSASLAFTALRDVERDVTNDTE